MARNSFYILSFGFTFSTLNFKFPSCLRQPPKPPIRPKLPTNYDSIITNKPNFGKAQMNVNVFSTKDYENVSLRRRGKNKPNQTQFQRQKMLLRLTINGWRKSFGYLRSFCAKKNGVVPPPVRPRILLTKPALPNFQYRQYRFWNLPKSGGPISSSSFFIRF